jgi:RNA polymerase sigma-70 factor (ECF subfamily)
MSTETQMRSAIPDDEIVRRFQKTGDKESFAELFVRHRKKVFLACHRFFPEAGMAEDATQETFLRAYQNMHCFQGGNFCGWLMRIARHVCIDEWRKHRPEVSLEETKGIERAGPERLEAPADLHLAIEEIYREMRSLSPEQRRCLELKIEGYSYEETATRMGLSVDAVKSHLQNGRRMLWFKMEGMLTQLR